MDIKIIRLSTGEDIISEFSVKEKSQYITLINPYKIVYMIAPNEAAYTVSLLPWIFPSIVEEKQYTLFPKDIITYALPSKEMISSYNKIRNREKENESVISELNEMDNNEQKINEKEFVDIVRKKLRSLGKRTLH